MPWLMTVSVPAGNCSTDRIVTYDIVNDSVGAGRELVNDYRPAKKQGGGGGSAGAPCWHPSGEIDEFRMLLQSMQYSTHEHFILPRTKYEQPQPKLKHDWPIDLDK